MQAPRTATAGPSRGGRSLATGGIALILLAGSCRVPWLPNASDTGDLSSIRERGTLRFLVPALPVLPRGNELAATERELAAAFARWLGVVPEFITVTSRADLLTRLNEGRGDLAAAQLTVTPGRLRRVDFTKALATVDEWVVGRRGDAGLPRAIAQLTGREIHVRLSSSFAHTLRELDREHRLGMKIIAVPEELGTESLAYAVSQGERPLTVVDSHLLESMRAYNLDLQPLFPVARGRRVAWAVRKTNTRLRAAADAFLFETQMTDHSRETSTGGLAEIRRRGALRVLMPNDPVSYFLHKGQPAGWDYHLAQRAAQSLHLRLEVVVPPEKSLLVPWLLGGRGDVVAGLVDSPERRRDVDFTRLYLPVEEVLVQGKASLDPVSGLAGLRYRQVHVRRSSHHYHSLLDLQEAHGPFTIIEVPEDQQTEELLARVASGDVPLAVVDSHLIQAQQAHRSDIEVVVSLPLRPFPDGASPPGGGVAFAVRRDNPKLRAFLDGFVRGFYRSTDYNVLRRRYFQDVRHIRRTRQERFATSGRLSPFDDLLKIYSRRYGFDWRLMAAQAYHESRFDPEARSWAGAVGLFQVLPSTAREMGLERLTDPETAIHGGVREMHRLVGRFDESIPIKHRMRLSLAAYNAGLGHLEDARRLARRRGWDANRWFGQTERAMRLLSQPTYHRQARYGYCRGSQVAAYVSQVQSLYENYTHLVPL